MSGYTQLNDGFVSSPLTTAGASGAVGGRMSATAASPTPVPAAGAMQLDTLDEPVLETIKRDLNNIRTKLAMVMFPRGRKDILRDWDLWGPLLLCLSLAICLGIRAPTDQTAAVFTGVFFIVWFGAAVVTLNSKLLGGTISFFQSVCVLGYCVFPLVLASIVGLFVPSIVVRAIIVVAAFAWSTIASVGFLSDSNLGRRRLLAVYPIGLFYFILGWMTLISKSLL